MNQLEKDRLIEKFMGWELIQNKSSWVFKKDNGEFLLGTHYNTSVVGFTTDWNWLMKALKKFDEAEECYGNKKYCEICDKIEYLIINYEIDPVVNALCEGIEWYNKTLN